MEKFSIKHTMMKPLKAEINTYLIKPKKAQIFHNRDGTDSGSCSNFSCYLQPNLYNLQRISEDDLGSSCLQTQKENELHY